MVETPLKAVTGKPAPPPSTVRKLFGWVLPGSTKTASQSSTLVAEPIDRKGKGKAIELADDAYNGSQWNQSMSQIGLGSSTPIPLNGTPAHPSSPAWKSARPAPSLLSATTNARPTPRTLSAILAESSSTISGSTSTRQDSLSFSQKSQALDALFGGSTSSASLSKEQARAVRVPIVKRTSSVKDMVKSFEESGAFDRSMQAGRGH